MHLKHLVAVITACALTGLPARAQTQLLTFEGGMRTDAHLNGVTQTTPFIGIAGTGVMSGSADKNFALLIPIAFETRIGFGSIAEIGGFGDIAMRTGWLTLGGGVAARWDFSDKIRDATIGGADGKVPVSYPIALGYSGFAKISAGPGGRLFVQVRYVLMPASMSYAYHSAADRQYAEENSITLADVTMRDSNTLRAAVGITFSKVIVRVQATQEQWRFDRIYNNTTGVYDRDTKYVSLGLSFIL